MALFGRLIVGGAALVASASVLGAQTPEKPTCDIGDALKGNTARAVLSFDVARQATGTPVAANNLKTVIKLVETPEKSGDEPVARAYVLGEALSLWLNQPGIGPVAKRGDLGFTTNPEGTIDLVGTLDSAFKVVEAAKPNCSDNTAYYRGGHKFYLDVANGAINALNADKLDSAEYYARQADRLFPASPYGTMVLGSVASKRQDNAKAVQYWTSAAETAGRDTSYRDVRRQMLANVGNLHLTDAQSASGAARTSAARKAADVYAQLIAVPGTRGSYLYGGRQNYQTALLLAGDTAAFVKSYEPLIAAPTSFEYQDLLNSAVNAARANRSADAAKLFEGTLVQNPWNRDALFNLAVTYLTLEQNDKVTPIVARLVAVDPANPENYYLGARAYLAAAKTAQTAKKTAVAAAYNDSTLSWYSKGNKLPIEVTFNEFSPSETQIVIGGSVLDRRDKIEGETAPAARPARGKAPAKPAAKTYPPKPATLRFEAIDKAGNPIASETVTTEALTPGKSATFTVKVAAPNAMAYRYTVVE
jgi:tetratricopeptide (TPR) repeat protein